MTPSLTYEISPLVLGESWSCKTPVISRDIGALGELVQNSGGGLCFNDFHDLARLLIRLANDHEERNRLGRNGHETYLREWHPDSHIEKYLNIVASVQQEKHA